MGRVIRPISTHPFSLAQLLDRHADAAWPAEEHQPLGPWVLRAASGVTQRANSVYTSGNKIDESCEKIDRLITSTEAFYAARWLPAVFYLSPAAMPANLGDLLTRRGYRIEESAEVWTAPADRLVQTIAPSPSESILLSDKPDAQWIDCAFDEPPQRRRVHQQIVHSITRRRVFASIRRGNLTVACGLAVTGEGWTGIFCMHTHPAHRRQGHASAILASLAKWSLQQHAPMLYLQLVADNLTAQRLYQRCGFLFAYPFHFWSKPR